LATADIIQLPQAPEPADSDGDGPTEVVVRIVLELTAEQPDEPEDEPEDLEPSETAKGGWIWFWVSALLGLAGGG
jgi:hypothetical protein